jgi:ABC-2 type transport system ATP-binding protein
MIEVQNLKKMYGEHVAVNDVSFSVSKGEILGFLGPNGAGKTTTMRIITGFMPPTSGKVLVDGQDVFDNPLEVKRKIGYLPEHPPLYNDMIVESYVQFAAQIKGVPGWQRKEAVDRALDRCGLQEVKGRLIGNLSKGFKQRVGLAQALVHDPDVLILDEPTIGLDPKQIMEIRALIKEIGSERTVILSTHILPEVTMICQRIVIINEGNVVAVDTYDGLISKLRKAERTAVRLKRMPENAADKLRAVPGVIGVAKDEKAENTLIVETPVGSDLSEQIVKVVVNEDWGLVEIRQMPMSLEDVFIKLTTIEEPVHN